jgi:hypothetical protein
MTPLLLTRDKSFEFNYIQYQPLAFDSHFVQDNLTATIAFYVNLMLGLAGDADAPLGGTPFFREMESIATGAQPYGWKGWERDRNSHSRSVVAAAFNDASGEDFRQMWYRYHTLGVDVFTENASQGLENMAAAVAFIGALH